MGQIEYDAYRYSLTIVIVFGILGNIFVILPILRQEKEVLKNSYYFFVLHLANCDLAVLIFYLYTAEEHWLEEPLSVDSPISCHGFVIPETFQLAGVRMMFIISLHRYRATVHALKPAISRQKLKILCGLVYLGGVIAACGTRFPFCTIRSTVLFVAFWKFCLAFWIFCAYLVPITFMTIAYYKISRSLIKQNKHMKRVCSNAMRQHEEDSSFNILRYMRNRRTFLACFSTVLCYGIGRIPASVWLMWRILGEYHLRMKLVWVMHIAIILRVAGSQSANRFIYGLLDKKLLKFWKN